MCVLFGVYCCFTVRMVSLPVELWLDVMVLALDFGASGCLTLVLVAFGVGIFLCYVYCLALFGFVYSVWLCFCGCLCL